MYTILLLLQECKNEESDRGTGKGVERLLIFYNSCAEAYHSASVYNVKE